MLPIPTLAELQVQWRQSDNWRAGYILAFCWLAATLGTTTAVVAQGMWPSVIGVLIGVAYIGVLIWYLRRAHPLALDLTDLPATLFPGLSYREMLTRVILTVAVLFIVAIPLHPVLVLTGVSAIVSLGLIIRWRSRVTLRLIGLSLGAGALVMLTQWSIGRLDPFMAFYLATIPLLFMAGGLLVGYSRLGCLRVLDGQGWAAVKSLGWGCVLAVPPALLNILGGAQRGDTWVDQWWEPVGALVPGIGEETWARLFLTSLVYVLLRPYTIDRPQRAVVAAVLIGALTHAFAHLPTLAILGPGGVGMLLAGLLYGVPMGLLFVKRDFEHAVAYHFLVDFVRFIAAFMLISING